MAVVSVTYVDGGIAFFLAAILTVAAVAKLLSPTTFATSLERLLPQSAWVLPAATPTRAARMVGLLEITLAAALLLLGGTWGLLASMTTVAVTSIFLLTIRRAMRMGVSCGCFGHLSRGPAGPAEIARGAVLLAVALAMTAIRLMSPSPRPSLSLPTLLVGFGLVIASIIAARTGAAFARTDHNRQSSLQDQPLADGRSITALPRSRRDFFKTSGAVLAGGFGVGAGLYSGQLLGEARSPNAAVGIPRAIAAADPPKVTSHTELPAAEASRLLTSLRAHGISDLMAKNVSKVAVSWDWDRSRAFMLTVEDHLTGAVTQTPLVFTRSVVPGSALLWMPSLPDGSSVLAGVGGNGIIIADGFRTLSWTGPASCGQGCLDNLEGCFRYVLGVFDVCMIICAGWIIARNGPAYLSCVLGCGGNQNGMLQDCANQFDACLRGCQPPVTCDCLCDIQCTANHEIEQCTSCICTDGSRPGGCVIGFPGGCPIPTVAPIPCRSCDNCPTPL
jgi:hypothetical protein